MDSAAERSQLKSTKSSNIIIRKAESKDCVYIHGFMQELITFLNPADAMDLTLETLTKDLCGEKPVVSAIVATTEEDPDTVIGYSLYCTSYSAWVGLCMYMEGLFVSEAYRGLGIGKKLWQRVSQIAIDLDCKGMRLVVEDWNSHAKDMYLRHGCIDCVEERNEHSMYLSREHMEEFVKK